MPVGCLLTRAGCRSDRGHDIDSARFPFGVHRPSTIARKAPAAGTVVLASDNMYLYENLTTHQPIAQTLDADSNLRAQDRMKTLASDPRLIVPGHDPAEFDRFPTVAPGVVEIK